MGKDLNGKELGTGLSQRKDGRKYKRVKVQSEIRIWKNVMAAEIKFSFH